MQFFLLFPSSGHRFQTQIVPNDHFAVVIFSDHPYILLMVKTNQFHIGHLVVVVDDHRNVIDGDVDDLADDVLDEIFFFDNDHDRDHTHDHAAWNVHGERNI